MSKLSEHTSPWLNAEKVLYLRHHGLGDLINGLPAIGSLRDAYPEAKLAVTLQTSAFTNLLAGSGVDRYFFYRSSLTGTFQDRRRLLSELLYLARFVFSIRRWGCDLLVGSNFMKPQHVLRLGRLGRCRWVIGECSELGLRRRFTRCTSPTRPLHACEANLAILSTAGIPVLDSHPRLLIREDEAEVAVVELFGRFNRPRMAYAVIHAGSGVNRENKRWPRENYRILGSHIYSKYSLLPVFVGDETERGYIESIVTEAPFPSLNAAGRLSLRQVAAILARSAVAIGNDSGIMHIAGAVGVPGIVIFGPTSPIQWRPYGKTIKALYSELPCSPCDHLLPRGCGRPICMSAIAPSLVMREIENIVRK